MRYKNLHKNNNGFTLLEIIVILGIMVLGIVGITQMTILFLKINADQKAQVTAIALANEKIEMIRNLPYNDIGSIGGIPAGNLVQNATTTRNNIEFNIKTEIIYIDDPFDGLISTTGSSGSIYNSSNSDLLYYWDMGSNTTGETPNVGSGTLTFTGTSLGTGYQGNGISMVSGDKIITTATGNIDTTQGRIGIWYKPNSSGGGSSERLVDVETDSGYFFIRRKSNQKLQFSFGGTSVSSPSLTWNADQWYFIEAAWEGTAYRQIWRDGVPMGVSETDSPAPVITNQLNIGNRGDSNESVNGVIDELYILNKAHKYEIWGYNQSNPYSSSNPQVTFYWNMDSTNSSQSPQIGSGTITLGGDYTSLDPGVKNSSLNFSNSGSDNDYALLPAGSNIDFANGRLAFWFRPRKNGVSSSDDYFIKASGCSDGNFEVIRDTNEKLIFNYGTSANNVSVESISLPWNKNYWTLIEIAFDDANDTVSTFVNGVEVATSNNTTIDAPVGCTGIYLANQSSVSNQNGDGAFDEVYILNDPFPSSNSSSDTLNTDYKRVKITVSWTGNNSTKELFLITDIAPPGIETTAGGGTLIINTLDANGLPVNEANIDVVNNTVDPPVNHSLTSDTSGRLVIPGAPATSTSYQVTVSKSGYSTDYTAAATSTYTTPVKDHLSVLEGQVTEASFIIDLVSTLNISTVSQSLPVNFQLNTDDSEENQSTPHLAVDNTYVYTTWEDYRDGVNFTNYNQKYTFAGTKQWTNDIQASTQAQALTPRTAVDASGNQYIVWSDNSSGDYDIYIQKISSAGTVQWSSPTKVNSDTGSSNQKNPDIAYYNNELYITWQDERNDAGDIFFNRINTSGTKLLGSDIKINSDTGSNTQTLPHIAIDTTGDAYISWLDNRNGSTDIYIDKINNTGIAQWGSEIKVNSNLATNISSYDIAQDNDAETHIAWTDNRNGNYDIFFQSIASSSVAVFSSDQTITTQSQSSNQESVRIDTTSTGDFMIGWHDDRSSDKDVYVLQTDNTGANVWSNEIRINLETSADQLLSDIAVYDNTKVIATWTDYSQGESNVWAGTLNYDGTESATPFVDFTLSGTKLTHTSPDKLKFEKTYSTDASGSLSITDLEWDTYNIQITEPGLTLTQSVPALPISIDPNTTQSIKLIVD